MSMQKDLESIVTQPDARLSQLQLLTETERHQILVEWNDTVADYPRDSCVHQLFESQVERTPNNVAVVHKGVQLTYAELNAKANQVARLLAEKDVSRDSIVGIIMDRAPNPTK